MTRRPRCWPTRFGHYQGHHVELRLALGLAVQLLCRGCSRSSRAGRPSSRRSALRVPSFHAVVALVTLGGGAFTFFLAPIQASLARRQERAADRAAVALSGTPAALASALVRLNGQNLTNLHPHPAYSAWHYSHPTLLERLQAIDPPGRGACPR